MTNMNRLIHVDVLLKLLPVGSTHFIQNAKLKKDWQFCFLGKEFVASNVELVASTFATSAPGNACAILQVHRKQG